MPRVQDDYDGYEDDWEDESPYSGQDYIEPKHSGLGIASFVLSLVVGVLIFVQVVLAVVVSMGRPGRQPIRDDSPEAIALGLGILCSLGFSLVGVGLGFGAFAQSDRKKVFAVLGVVFNLLIIVGTGMLIVVGNLMKNG